MHRLKHAPQRGPMFSGSCYELLDPVAGNGSKIIHKKRNALFSGRKTACYVLGKTDEAYCAKRGCGQKKAQQGKEEGNLAALENTHPNRSLCFSGSCYRVLDPFGEKDSKKDLPFFHPRCPGKKTAQGKEEGNLALKNGNPTRLPIFKMIRSLLTLCS